MPDTKQLPRQLHDSAGLLELETLARQALEYPTGVVLFAVNSPLVFRELTSFDGCHASRLREHAQVSE